MRYALLISMSFSLLLSACSGGGSAPATGGPPVNNGPRLVIGAVNSKPAARVAYGATMQSVDAGGLVGTSGIASSPGGGVTKPQVDNAISSAFARAMQKVPLGPDTYPCGDGSPTSGTMTISGELATLFTLTPGDTINVDAMNCDEGLGEVLNGRIEFTVDTFSGDLVNGLYLLVMDVLLIDFEVATATDTVLSNGDSEVSVDTTGTPLLAMSISGNSLATVSMTSSKTISAFRTAQTVDTTVPPEPFTLTAAGTVDSSVLDGLIDYGTPLTFQGLGAAYPYAGELLITGANGATIRLIALDEINVRIETDTDGDGVVDSSEDTTWDDIAG